MGIFDGMLGRESAVDYKEMIQKGAIFVDVSSDMDFDGGAAPNSINIPLQELEGKVNELSGKTVILVLDQELGHLQHCLFYTKMGSRQLVQVLGKLLFRLCNKC